MYWGISQNTLLSTNSEMSDVARDTHFLDIWGAKVQSIIRNILHCKNFARTNDNILNDDYNIFDD